MTDQKLIIEASLPSWDVEIAEHRIVRADPATTWRAARDLDLLTVHTPLLDAAFWVRGLPNQIARRPISDGRHHKGSHRAGRHAPPGQSMLRAVAEGRGRMLSGCHPALSVDGRWCDFPATSELVGHDLVRPAWPAPAGTSAPAAHAHRRRDPRRADQPGRLIPGASTVES